MSEDSNIPQGPPSAYFAWMYFHNPMFMQIDLAAELQRPELERGDKR